MPGERFNKGFQEFQETWNKQKERETRQNILLRRKFKSFPTGVRDIPNLIKGYYCEVCFMVILFPKKCSNGKIFCSRDKNYPRHQRQMLAIKSVMW